MVPAKLNDFKDTQVYPWLETLKWTEHFNFDYFRDAEYVGTDPQGWVHNKASKWFEIVIQHLDENKKLVAINRKTFLCQ